MHKYLILASFGLFLAFQGRSQLKFGMAAGYESAVVSNPFNPLKPGGGFSYAFLLTAPVKKNFELHFDLDIANWNSSYTGWAPGGPRGIPLPTVYYTATPKITHIVFPVTICYTVPVKNASLFAGMGLFMANTHYSQPSSSFMGFGPSFTGGIRCKWGLVITAEFRPAFGGSANHYTSDPATFPIEGVKNDYAFRIGYQFWQRKPHS